MRTILWFIYFWIYLLAILPKMLYYKHLVKNGRKAEAMPGIEKVVQNWASALLKAAGVTCTVTGVENIPKDRAVLFVSNHQGNFDIPLSITRLGKTNPIVAKDSLEKLPFISTWMKLFDCLFIDRENARQSLKVFAEAGKLIENGRSIIIFPEGTRSKGAEAGEFKAGAFKIAFKSGAPIVPFAIDGSYKAMEANGFWIKPTHVNITILPPIETVGMSKELERHIGVTVREMIMECNSKVR